MYCFFHILSIDLFFWCVLFNHFIPCIIQNITWLQVLFLLDFRRSTESSCIVDNPYYLVWLSYMICSLGVARWLIHIDNNNNNNNKEFMERRRKTARVRICYQFIGINYRYNHKKHIIWIYVYTCFIKIWTVRIGMA